MAEKEKTAAKKSIEVVKKVRGLVKKMYEDARREREEGCKVAYCMVGSGYDEILRAMKVQPIWTENYSALCAVKRQAERFILKAESEGFANDLCGYMRCGLGFDAMRGELGGAVPPDAPDGGMAMPDMLLGSSFGCEPRYKWYEAVKHYFPHVPLFNFDIVAPPVDADLGEVKNYYVKYQTEQFKELVKFLEKQTGKKMDITGLSEIIKYSESTMKAWYESYLLRAAIPCPMGSGDHFTAFVPAFFMLGTKEAMDFYYELYQELRYRVDNKMGVVSEEKYRLLWASGLPPWHTMWMFNYFEDKGAVFVRETSQAYYPWDPFEVPVSLDDPLRYLAYRSFLRLTHKYEEAKRNKSWHGVAELLMEFIRDYKLDGMVMHASKSCRTTTIGQIHLKDVIQGRMDIPALQLTSDIVDIRDFSEAEWKAKIDAFIEALENSKKRARQV
jgi:benzoyl-CoA reductase/2-hydroxyglutaryl-CoA dehydratase subunit BcrC/BadD/HgdB